MGDFSRVLALWKKTEGMGLGESDTRSGIARFLRRNPRMSLVAVDGRRIVGAVLCGHDGRRGYLHHLAVEAGCRGRGLGRLLVAACLARLRDAGIAKCNIFLYADNSAGETFWRRLGWRVRDDLRMVQTSTRASGAKPKDRRSC
jgi:ribosomal protein S18 acetylase RimI-like enzyme